MGDASVLLQDRAPECRQTPDGAVSRCTSNKHNTQKTETRRVHYRWHPCFDCDVLVRSRVARPTGEAFRSLLGKDERHFSVEIPGWMFDRGTCSRMQLVEEPHVAWEALLELKWLLTRGDSIAETEYKGGICLTESQGDKDAAALETEGPAAAGSIPPPLAHTERIDARSEETTSTDRASRQPSQRLSRTPEPGPNTGGGT